MSNFKSIVYKSRKYIKVTEKIQIATRFHVLTFFLLNFLLNAISRELRH